MFESFSIEIEIMKRLPVKSLIRFRGVSKGWKSLIESSEFITAHSRHRHTHPHHLLATNYVDRCRGVCLSSFSDDDNFPPNPSNQQHLTVPPSLGQLSCVFHVGTSHGLACLDGYSRNFGTRMRMAVIWNPSTRKSIIIPLPDCSLACLGFGVCPVTCDPKLLWIDSSGRSGKLYKCSSGEWGSIAMSDEGHWDVTVTTKNFIYSQWISEKKIVSFDLTRESFEATDIPVGTSLDDLDDDYDYNAYYMSNIRESLAVIVPISETRTTVDVWVLLEEEEEDGVHRSFTKMYNIITPSKFDLILGCSKNEMLIVLQANHDYDDVDAYIPPSLVVYDLNSNVLKAEGLTYDLNAQSKLLEIGGFNLSTKVQAYEETLLLLDCHNSV